LRCALVGVGHPLSLGNALGEQGVDVDPAAGQLVPDDLVGDIVREKVRQLRAEGEGVLFDGYPRNLEQAEFLDACLGELDTQIDIVVVLEVSDEELVKRICGRRLCSSPECEGSFNIYSMPPRQEGKCDLCGADLMTRKDDNEETLSERLDVYQRQTLPILDFYGQKNLLIRVAASGRVSEIRRSVLAAIEHKSGGGKPG
jgi:adenylate kinase